LWIDVNHADTLSEAARLLRDRAEREGVASRLLREKDWREQAAAEAHITATVAEWLDTIAGRHVPDAFAERRACRGCCYEPAGEEPCPDVAAALTVADATIKAWGDSDHTGY
jgi:hypothetical protein